MSVCVCCKPSWDIVAGPKKIKGLYGAATLWLQFELEKGFKVLCLCKKKIKSNPTVTQYQHFTTIKMSFFCQQQDLLINPDFL